MHRTAAETRGHILEVAHELFYWHGVRAVGVDRVAAAAGVAPTTLYRLFSSKDDLVAAYVERANKEFRAWFTLAIENAGPDPRDQVLAIFDELAIQVQPDRCRGCAFLMVLAEFPDPALPAHRHAVTAKGWVRDRMGALADQLSLTTTVADPAALADQLTLVMEGVNASVQAHGADGPAVQARALAEIVLTAATNLTGVPNLTQ
jgi:AcrR family transcriptional regulator